MAGGLRLTTAARAWCGVAATLVAGSLLAWWWPATLLDWQPALAAEQPWRWWSAAFVHWSEWHLAGNLAAAVVVAALGIAGEVPRGFALAWIAAWPLTHLALLVQPALAHYGGLSGVLHAGVAVAAFALMVSGTGRRRWIGTAVAAGLTAKVLVERPWSAPLPGAGGWEIALSPLAHASGALAGAVCAAIAAWARRTATR